MNLGKLWQCTNLKIAETFESPAKGIIKPPFCTEAGDFHYPIARSGWHPIKQRLITRLESFTPTWATKGTNCRATWTKFKLCCAVNWVSCEAKPLRVHRTFNRLKKRRFRRFHQRFRCRHCHKLAVFLYLLLETWFPKCSYFMVQGQLALNL